MCVVQSSKSFLVRNRHVQINGSREKKNLPSFAFLGTLIYTCILGERETEGIGSKAGGDSIAPAAEACGGDSNGQNYELTDAESSSSASEVQVCMDTEYFLGIR